jgi:transcriptional regulator with XRE-family HTH domain
MDVAKAINTSQRNVSRWENGENEPTLSYISQLAEFFNVSADYLIGLEDDFGAPTTTTAGVAAPMSNTYTVEERKIIEDYRQLNFYGKKLVKQTLDTLTAPSSANAKKDVN